MSSILADEQAAQARALELFNQGRYDEAADELLIVARQLPNSAGVLSNLATTLSRAGRPNEAVSWLERALVIDPLLVAAHVNLATALVSAGQPLKAVAKFREAQGRLPNDPGLQFAAGQCYFAQGLREEANAAFARAVGLAPEFAKARWMQFISSLPQVYGPGEDPAAHRRAFVEELRSLAAWFDQSRAHLGPDAVSESQPFYLAFMEESNREILSEYGDLCTRLMSWLPVNPASWVNAVGPIRLAIVCGYLYDQSVWTALLRGLCAHLDRGLIEIHLFHTRTKHDRETELARSYAKTYVSGLDSLQGWVDAITAVAPDVILYPEIGMDSISARLAAMRLAPVQVTTWGHPETSGYSTLDFYLSAEALEPDNAQENYREKLVMLPGIGCYYDDLVPDFEGVDWASFGIDAFAPRLLCAGSPFKYMPRDDALLVEIARRAPDVQLVFFIDSAPTLSMQIESRFQKSFAESGLDARRNVRFIPRQSRPTFFAMLRDSDAMLDTVGFSGFNTAMQAIECDLPLVAWEGRFMRGRLASGPLRLMGMDELVATSAEQYVSLAVKLACDSTYRLKLSARMAERKAVLFRDLAPVRAFERFLLDATGRSSRA